MCVEALGYAAVCGAWDADDGGVGVYGCSDDVYEESSAGVVGASGAESDAAYESVGAVYGTDGVSDGSSSGEAESAV